MNSNLNATSGVGLLTNTTGTSLLNHGCSTTGPYGSIFTTAGSNNTAIGHHSLSSITTGTNNIAIGYSALAGYSTELLEFYDMMLEALGYDSNKREDFFKMSKEERKSVLREVKINRVLNK